MIRKILLLLLPVLALGGGIAAGAALQRGEPGADDAHAAAPAEDGHAASPVDAGRKNQAAPGSDDGHGAAGHAGRGWFTFPGQFFVPLARNGDMGAMMIVTLVLETDGSSVDALGRHEHRLRDALLRQLLIHANTGGFDGNYTVTRNLDRLRTDLLKVAQASTNIAIHAVLIEDIVRQGG